MIKTNSNTVNLLKSYAEAIIPTDHGNFRMIAFAEEETEKMPHLALVHEEMNPSLPVVTRIHSECLTGDLFGSNRCDCGEQLQFALKETGKSKGIILYLRQEGRGIGLINKLKANNLQDLGFNTIEANTHLGFEPDERDFSIAIEMLCQLQVRQIKLMTNNPEKLSAFADSGIEITERIPVIIPPKEENSGYLKVKRDQMGHLLGTDLEI